MNDARGYLDVLRNRHFLVLWLAQLFSLLALNSTLFVIIILIEKATQSSTQNAALIAAFSLPAVLLAALAGIVVDRVSKRDMLVVSNGLRVFFQLALTVLAALGLQRQIDAALLMALIYVLIFSSSAVGQFFAPAEGATIPLLVGRAGLFTANSLFTFTVIASQVAALVILVPVAVKTLGVIGTLVLLTIFYLVATVLVMSLPRDPAPPRARVGARGLARQAWHDLAEGWSFSLRRPPIILGILQISLVGMLVFVMATLAPGYSARVLGLDPEDAIFVFSPAGGGMLLASILVVRFGPRFARHTPPIGGFVLMGLALITLGGVGQIGAPTVPLFRTHAEWTVSVTSLVGGAAFFAGIALALILVPAQTAVQEEATDQVRGRVLTVQFTLANAIGLLPLLTIGGLADVFGIADVTVALGVSLLLVAGLNFLLAQRLTQRRTWKPVTEAFPLPGADPSTVRVEEEAAQ